MPSRATLVIAFIALAAGFIIASAHILEIPFVAFFVPWAALLCFGLLLLSATQTIENKFLIVFLLLAGCSFVFIPPFSTPDFQTQFCRAFEIAQGTIVTTVVDTQGNALLPENLIPANLEAYGKTSIGPNYHIISVLFSTHIDPQNLTTYNYVAQALYSPLTFLPSALAIKISLLFTTNLGIIVYAARFVTLATIATILFSSIRLLPESRDKTLFSLFALLPLFLETCPSASADGLTYSLIAALFAYVMHLRNTPKRVSYPILGILVFSLALIKVVYLPICLLTLLIPYAAFGSSKKKVCVLIILAAVALTLNILWLETASQFLSFKPGVDTSEQIKAITSNPLSFLLVLFNTIIQETGRWICFLFGQGLNSYGIQPALILPLILLIVFAFSCGKFSKVDHSTFNRRERYLIWFIASVVFFLTLLSLYLQWNPVRNPIIEGFQGRYLEALFPLLFATICGPKLALSEKQWSIWFATVCLIFLYPLGAVY